MLVWRLAAAEAGCPHGDCAEACPLPQVGWYDGSEAPKGPSDPFGYEVGMAAAAGVFFGWCSGGEWGLGGHPCPPPPGEGEEGERDPSSPTVSGARQPTKRSSWTLAEEEGRLHWSRGESEAKCCWCTRPRPLGGGPRGAHDAPVGGDGPTSPTGSQHAGVRGGELWLPPCCRVTCSCSAGRVGLDGGWGSGLKTWSSPGWGP